jgi:hypothetical protein
VPGWLSMGMAALPCSAAAAALCGPGQVTLRRPMTTSSQRTGVRPP